MRTTTTREPQTGGNWQVVVKLSIRNHNTQALIDEIDYTLNIIQS